MAKPGFESWSRIKPGRALEQVCESYSCEETFKSTSCFPDADTIEKSKSRVGAPVAPLAPTAPLHQMQSVGTRPGSGKSSKEVLCWLCVRCPV